MTKTTPIKIGPLNSTPLIDPRLKTWHSLLSGQVVFFFSFSLISLLYDKLSLLHAFKFISFLQWMILKFLSLQAIKFISFSSMDSLEDFLNWFVVGWSVAAVLSFAVSWVYMPNIFADKVMKWRKDSLSHKNKRRKEEQEKKRTNTQQRVAQLRIRKQIATDRFQNAKVREEHIFLPK